MFASAAGINLTHIPYKGVAEAAISVMSGEVEMLFASSPAVSPQIKAGRLRALAVTSLEPSALLPGLPAIAHSLASADMKKFLSEQNIEVWALPAAQLTDLLPREIERYRKAAKAAGILAP